MKLQSLAWLLGMGATLAGACSSEGGGGGGSGEAGRPGGAGEASGGEGASDSLGGAGGRSSPEPQDGGEAGQRRHEDGGRPAGGAGATDSAGAGGGAGEPGFTPGPDWPPSIDHDGVCSPDGWCWRVPSTTGSALDAVWGASASDVWAIGKRARGCGASIIHYDGERWRGTTCIQSVDPVAISGTSGSDVWILAGTEMLHFDGNAWARLPSGTAFELVALHAAGANEAWAAGKGGAMVRWNGSTWQPFASGTTNDIIALWAFSASDIWRATKSGVAHFNGVQWSSTVAPTCERFWASGPQDLYCYSTSQAWRWGGSAWTSLGYNATGESFRAIWGDGEGSALLVGDPAATYRASTTELELADYQTTPTEVVRGLWAPTGGSYVAVGEREESGPIWTFGSTWGAANTPSILWPIGDDEAGKAAVTSTGTVWLALRSAKLQSWNGATFTAHDTDTEQPLHAIAVGPDDDIWAGGEQGVVTHRVAGAGTFQASSVAPFTVEAIWLDESGNPWVGGGDGNVFARSGSSWHDHSVAMSTVKALWGRSSTDVYAGGSGVFHFDGTWHDTQFPESSLIEVVWGDSGRVFAFDGRVWQLAAGEWSLLSGSVGTDGPTFLRDDTLWAVRSMPKVSRWNGSRWDEFRLPDSDIYLPVAIAAGADGEAWVFGSGTVRHYRP